MIDYLNLEESEFTNFDVNNDIHSYYWRVLPIVINELTIQFLQIQSKLIISLEK